METITFDESALKGFDVNVFPKYLLRKLEQLTKEKRKVPIYDLWQKTKKIFTTVPLLT